MKNRKGFTLIELLAVITIMGILMLVAIPAVSRTIENTRRQTFANTALQYIKSVKNEVSSDQITCDGPNGSTTISAAPINNYYYLTFDSDYDYQYENGKDLMEQGGTSAWGGVKVRGAVGMYKYNDSNNRTIYEYSVIMFDSAGRGIGEVNSNYYPTNLVVEKNVTRSQVNTKDTNNYKKYYVSNRRYFSTSYYTYVNGAQYGGGTSSWYRCYLNG